MGVFGPVSRRPGATPPSVFFSIGTSDQPLGTSRKRQQPVDYKEESDQDSDGDGHISKVPKKEVILGQDLDYYEKFSSNNHLKPSQTLSETLFCSLPRTDPPSVRYAKASPSQCVEGYEGDILPKRSHGSFFQEVYQAQFRKEFNADMQKNKSQFRGFQSLSFGYRVQNSEGDAQESILTNVINPVLEVVQCLAPEGYRIAVGTHATQDPPSNGETSNSGTIDHIIFAIPAGSDTSKLTRYQLDQDLSTADTSRWRALAIIECKGFNMIHPTEYSRLSAKHFEKHPRQTPIKLEDLTNSLLLNLIHIIPQLRKYSDLFHCDNLIVSDYSHSIAFDIPHRHAGSVGCLMEAQECGGGFTPLKPLVNGKMTDSPLSYGFRCTLFYLIWHSLRRLKECSSEKEPAASSVAHSGPVASGSGSKRNDSKGKKQASRR